jgi:hypothetical protein
MPSLNLAEKVPSRRSFLLSEAPRMVMFWHAALERLRVMGMRLYRALALPDILVPDGSLFDASLVE